MATIEGMIEKILAYNPRADLELIKKAYIFSQEAHCMQKRMEGTPYIHHPLAVADILADMKLDTATIAAGLLHDTVEDTGMQKADIKDIFGTEIAFLVDAYQGKAAEYRFVYYVLFVTYFPHLIAGPVLHHKEMMPQFKESSTYNFSYENLLVGLTIFFMGLFKKVVLADGMILLCRGRSVRDSPLSGTCTSTSISIRGRIRWTVFVWQDSCARNHLTSYILTSSMIISLRRRGPG